MKKILYPMYFIWSTGFNMVYRLLPAYLTRFTSSAVQIGTVNSAYSLAKALSLPCGMAVDRIGKVRSLFMVLFFLPFIAISLSLFTQVWQFAVAFFIVGLLANFYYTAANAIVGMFKGRTESFFRLEAVYQLGFVVGPFVGGFLMLNYGGYAAFYTWTALSLIGLLLSVKLLRTKDKPAEKDGKKKIGLREIAKTMKGKLFIFLAIGGFLPGMLLSMKDLVIPLYAVKLGMNIYIVGVILAISSIVSVVALPLLGKRLEDKKKERAIALGLVFMALGFLAMNFATDFIIIGLLTGLFMVGRNVGLNITRSFIASHLEEKQIATGMSLVETTQFAGAIAGPIIAALLIDFVSFQSVFYLIGTASLIGAVIMFTFSLGKKMQ
jgi:MFS family permease